MEGLYTHWRKADVENMEYWEYWGHYTFESVLNFLPVDLNR